VSFRNARISIRFLLIANRIDSEGFPPFLIIVSTTDRKIANISAPRYELKGLKETLLPPVFHYGLMLMAICSGAAIPPLMGWFTFISINILGIAVLLLCMFYLLTVFLYVLK
jgi:hypothetical protein